MNTPDHETVKLVAKQAVKTVYESLKVTHQEEFYYLALVTTGEALPPAFTAWSHEALKREAAKSSDGEAEYYLKWSYGESPYFCYQEDKFDELREIFSQRPEMKTSMSKSEWLAEYDFRLNALESALRELDQEGLFGVGESRNQIMINVEVVPPDWTNTERAKRLNSPSSLPLKEWLKEMAE